MTALLISSVVESALRGLLFAAVVGAGLSLLRVRHVPSRKAAWTLVLIASVAMPALLRWPLLAGLRGKLAWVVPIRITAAAAIPAAPSTASSTTVSIPLAFVPASAEASLDTPSSAPAETRSAPAQTASLSASAMKNPAPAPHPDFAWPPIQRMAIWLYLVVAGALLLRLLIGLAAALRLWLTAEPVSPLVAPDGNVRASTRIASPVTIGSGIVLPAGYRGWDTNRLRMVLAHERSHVRQMDFWLQLLASLYTAAFWFSPLGWFLRRKLAQLGETISDRAGIEAGESSSAYAQVVLDFASLSRRRVPGVAMASTGNLTRRIDALLNERRFRSAFAEGRRRALLSLLLIPAALFAATTLIRAPIASAQTIPAAPAPAAAPAQAPSAPAAPRIGQAFAGQKPNADQVTGLPPQSIPAPPPTAAPVAPSAPTAAPQMVIPPGAEQTPPPPPPPTGDEGQGLAVGAGQSSRSSDTTTITRHGTGSRSGDFVYHASPDGNAWAVAGGTWNDANLPVSLGPARRAQLERAHRTANGPFLWFTRDGKSYVITDPAVIAQFEAQLQAMDDLGMQQRLLGQTQSNLGKKMEAMTRLQNEAAVAQIPDVQAMIPQIEASLQQAQKQMQDQLTPQKMAAIQAELRAELSPAKMAAMEAELKDAEAQLTPEKMAAIQAQLKTELSPAKMAEIDVRIKAAQAEWNARNLAQLQQRLGEAQAQLGKAQAEMGARQGEFGAKMGRLGEQMGKLGEEQGRLGAKQGQLSRDLNNQVQQAIQRALANGSARPTQ